MAAAAAAGRDGAGVDVVGASTPTPSAGPFSKQHMLRGVACAAHSSPPIDKVSVGSLVLQNIFFFNQPI